MNCICKLFKHKVMKQIRIYYESIEQGANFIKPIVESVVDKNTEIILVRRPKKASELNDGAISALLTMTTPDALITGVFDDKEIPLVVIEFTEAVTTEDHELQRTYGAIAAHLAGAYYLKLSGEKKSEKEFGGAKYNPYSTPKIFIDKFNHNGITLTWDKRKLVKTTRRDFIPAFAKYFGFRKYTKPTPIVEIHNEVDEDEVTYAIVHRVLIPNGFKIVSVSYPGSQGGGAILPNPDLGKAQPREYPDVIAMPPAGTNIDVVLNESKGMFTEAAVNKDIAKILRYKNEPAYKSALKETLVVAQVIDNRKQLKNIVVGVSFGLNKEIKWNPGNVDFVFVVQNRKQWSILYNSKMSKIIKKTDGKTLFPTVFKCDKQK